MKEGLGVPSIEGNCIVFFMPSEEKSFGLVPVVLAVGAPFGLPSWQLPSAFGAIGFLLLAGAMHVVAKPSRCVDLGDVLQLHEYGCTLFNRRMSELHHCAQTDGRAVVALTAAKASSEFGLGDC